MFRGYWKDHLIIFNKIIIEHIIQWKQVKNYKQKLSETDLILTTFKQ